ncbi:hypothetical protein Q4561_18195 [Alteromonas sp. 1_MG-2023]|uniref:hypothetical protein n=1 Tax=Alteromonas sp. 1_MG-2023 TaxID=3062669 RepID=UPI0026E23056|nr:hypothetical protein [Alteromonas sp. 1_MG-2023]MDO6569009.1 hypothetical protein [Alteromonas sp. 1_MG-2023]
MTGESKAFSGRDVEEGVTSSNGASSPFTTGHQGIDIAELDKGEMEWLSTQRSKLKLVNPEAVYRFRNSKISYYHSFCHFVLLVLLSPLLIGFLILPIFLYKTHVQGIGDVGALNFVDHFTITLIVFFSIFKIWQVFKVKGAGSASQYRLAIIANSIGRGGIGFFKLSIIVVACYLPIISMYPDEKVSDAFLHAGNGVFSDTFDLVCNFLLIFILLRSFRWLGRG